MRRGKQAAPNPWHANTLEWQTPSPPPHENFVGRIPTVYHGPYEYSVPGQDGLLAPERGPVGARPREDAWLIRSATGSRPSGPPLRPGADCTPSRS